MNNPLQLLVTALQRGADPTQLIAQMARNNPQMAQASRMISGKSPQQLQQMAMNMAAERGTSVEDIARQLGIQLPSNR